MPTPIRNDEIRAIPLESLRRTISTPRSHYDEAHLERLTRSISRRGLLQPLVVRPIGATQFEVVAGEGRFIAAQRAGLERIDCRVRLYADSHDDTAPLGDVDALEDAFIENVIREDLTGLEKAEAMLELIAHRVGETPAFVLKRLAVMHNRKRRKRNDVITELKSDEDILQVFVDLGAITWQGFFTNWAPLLNLEPEVKRLVQHRKLNYTLAKRLNQLEPDKRGELVQAIETGLSGQALQQAINQVLGKSKSEAERQLERIRKGVKTKGITTRVRDLFDQIECELESVQTVSG
jgi:ParB family transcriptional regulator, chromosome partitioning protein